MTLQRVVRMCVALLLVFSARLSAAQVLTGAVFGTVEDETGGVLPGATVRISSPALIGGQSAAITNERGQFRFASLAAGDYTLEVELADFGSYREGRIAVDVQGTVERTVILKVGAIAESVSVRSEERRVGKECRSR